MVDHQLTPDQQQWRDELLAQGRLLQEVVATDFVSTHPWLRYTAAEGVMRRFAGGRWVVDDTNRTKDDVRHYCQSYFLPRNGSPKTTESLSKRRTIEDVWSLACIDQRIAAKREQWDSDPYLLGTPYGGTVDLRTGERHPAEPDDYITRSTAVVPGGDCSRFLAFLGEITEQRVELIDYLQRLCGLCLIGEVLEHVLVFCYGGGANGKSTFLNIIRSTLADYAHVAETETFLESRGERHPTDLAQMAGCRLVIAEELEEGRRWATARIKQLTGGGAVTARFMRQDSFTFQPTHTLILAGNHKPSLRTVDEAIRRRLHLVPFLYTVPPEDRDPHLPAKLEAERGGILQWMIDGCLAYQREGLNPPGIVLDATDEYFDVQDELKSWCEDCCITGTDKWETPTALFTSWRRWCEVQQLNPGTMKTFGDQLESAGYRRAKSGQKGRHWTGLSVKAPLIDTDK